MYIRVAWILFLFLFLPRAEAARAYFDGNFASVSTTCPVWPFSVVIASQSNAGYFTDPNEPYPKTGDIAYVRASTTNISPCTNDLAGFDFFLPDGAELAISNVNPVYCFRFRISDGYTEPVSCSQQPSIGNFGGYYFGYSALASGWQFQIQVPVRFNKQLLGMAGSNTQLGVGVRTAWGDAAVYQWVTVFYQASFQNTQSSGVTASAATLSTNLYSYYKGGLLSVEYGTSPALGSSVPPATVPDTSLNFPNISTTLTGLNTNTTYYWRYRFITGDGTFDSPMQSFTTGSSPVQTSYPLSVSANGTGSGLVTSNPAGISCGSACSASFAAGTSVTLSATPAIGSTFGGWGGSCAGTNLCTVAMDMAKTVTASFNSTSAEFGTLNLEVAGLPAGSEATVHVSGANGVNLSRTILAGTGVSLSDLPTGTYLVSAANVAANGSTYLPVPATQNVTVNTGSVTTSIAYQLETGASLADLALALSDTPDPITVGETLTYSLTATNNGPATATGVMLTNLLANGVGFVSASPGCSPVGSTVQCVLGDLASGAQAQATISVQPMSAGDIANVASVSANEADPIPSNNSATETTTVSAEPLPPGNLAVRLAANRSRVTVGRVLRYKIRAKNAGGQPIGGVKVIDTLPPGSTFHSAKTGCAYNPENHTVTCEIGTLNARISKVRWIKVTVNTPGPITNTVRITGLVNDQDQSNNARTLTTSAIGNSAVNTVQMDASGTVAGER